MTFSTPSPFVPDTTPPLARPAVARVGPAATTQAILTQVGETVYEWDVKSDRLRWGGNVRQILSIEDARSIATGRAYDTLVDVDSVTNRHQAVMNGFGIDYGEGVPYEITYALRLPRNGEMRSVWVNDCGLWFADEDGTPYLARGVLRLARSQVARAPVAPELPRRGEFLKLLESALAVARHYRTRYAFVVLSVDNMPMVADAFGPAALDQAEAAIVERMRHTLRVGDLAGHLSDSEIGIILRVGDEVEAAQAIERLVRAMGDEMVSTDAGPIGPMVSAGVVMIPAGAASIEDCLARARAAQREARGRGAGHCVFHSLSRAGGRPKLPHAAVADLLMRALGEDRLVLARQPVVRAADGTVAFHECLARLVQDDGTLLPMGDAIVVAEALGLMRRLDLKVQDLVFAMLATTDGALALNVSVDTLRSREWLDRLLGHLAGRPGLAQRLIVEVAETALVHDIDVVAETMSALKEAGCRTAIDDFGAGYTSLRNLKALAVDMVKIDGSFVHGLAARPGDRVFARTLIGLAKDFGIETVAEMVEDGPAAAELRELGIDYLQGYHLGRPEAGEAPAEAPTQDATATR